MSRLRWLQLGVPDVVFGFVLLTVLVGDRTGVLGDPGTFWHAHLGREMVRTGDVPRHDTLTFTRDGVAWVDQSWAFDLGLAAVVDRWGWSASVALTALGLALLYGMLARGLVHDGASPLAAVVVSILAMEIGTIHFLVRPHLLTFGLTFYALRACQKQHERGGWAIAGMPLAMVIWANVHGGFVAGLVILLTAGVAHALSGPWDEARKRNVARFAGIFVFSGLATLVNPYGIGLYRHVATLLYSSGVTSLIVEFQPIPFGKKPGRVVEWVILALVALPSVSSRRIDRYQLIHTLVWLHLALGSVRHAPIFALAAAPALAQLIDGLPLAWSRAGRERVGWSLWPVLASLVILAAIGLRVPFGEFSRQSWPLSALPALDRQPADARLFHEQDWGGLIEAECRPRRRTFVDDRFELFGKAAIVQYSDALTGGPEWDELSRRDGFGLVWVRPERGLARRLAADPQWQILHRDSVSILFGRKVETATRSQERPKDLRSPEVAAAR